MMQRLVRLDSRQRNLVAIGLVGVLLAAMSVYVVVPQVKDFRSKSASRKALIGIAGGGGELPREIDARLEAIGELTQRLHGESAHLPLRQMESFVIGRLQKICWDHDIELISVKPDEGERIAEFFEILFRVELEGTYGALYPWLHAVRRELGFIVVKELALSRIDQAATDPILRATLTMATYRMEDR